MKRLLNIALLTVALLCAGALWVVRADTATRNYSAPLSSVRLEVRAECLASLMGHYPKNNWWGVALEYNAPGVCELAVAAADGRQMIGGHDWRLRLKIARTIVGKHR